MLALSDRLISCVAVDNGTYQFLFTLITINIKVHYLTFWLMTNRVPQTDISAIQQCIILNCHQLTLKCDGCTCMCLPLSSWYMVTMYRVMYMGCCCTVMTKGFLANKRLKALTTLMVHWWGLHGYTWEMNSSVKGTIIYHSWSCSSNKEVL